MLEPRYPRETGGACRAARGRTIAASPRVRVYERTTPSGAIRRLACRRGGDRAVRIDAGVPAPRIAGDRWLLSLGAGRPATVVDMHAGDVVTSVDASVATLLGDGALAWFGSDGRALAQRPAGDAPVELAAADPAPSALASSRHTVYWTSGGAPRGARPPRG